jgi:lipopolysaccharide transport system ATP-binding protein
MSDVVITVENLWKQYRYGVLSHRALYKDLQSWWARFRGKEDPNSRLERVRLTKNQELRIKNEEGEAPDRFWALRDVSFEVKRGEVLGIIGRNGAGKSTLLKIMSRVTTPTKGEVKIKGRVASLLEVGTGFHPELTGRENIFLNGAILGMTKNEIKKKFDEIVGFAEIEKFIDTPVKRYSSGMYVRLAFAVAAHLEPEILIIDEVLAVGDAQFQKKCLGKMGDVAKEGRTVLFVSHNMDAVRRLCDQTLILQQGSVSFSGYTDEAIHRYSKDSALLYDQLSLSFFTGSLTKWLRFDKVQINDQTDSNLAKVSFNSDVIIKIFGYADIELDQCNIIVGIERESVRFATLHDLPKPAMLKKGPFCSEVSLPAAQLRPGEYSISLGGNSEKRKEWMWGSDILSFIVLEDTCISADECKSSGDHSILRGRRIQDRV